MVIGLATVSALAAAAMYPPSASAHTVDAGVLPLCRVIEAAYTAAIRSEASAYPSIIVPSQRRLRLEEWVPQYRSELPLTPAEFDDLTARQDSSGGAEFRPVCVPTVKPTLWRDEQGHAMSVSFSAPIVSASGDLAIVEVSFREEGRFGFGKICVVRATGGRWQAQCLQSWIT